MRRLIVLHDIEELTLEEISAVVGAPLTTVHSRLKTARAKLAQAYQHLAPERAP
jgi:DNA-directed RNA polymerase specialized sigma24 family protein